MLLSILTMQTVFANENFSGIIKINNIYINNKIKTESIAKAGFAHFTTTNADIQKILSKEKNKVPEVTESAEPIFKPLEINLNYEIQEWLYNYCKEIGISTDYNKDTYNFYTIIAQIEKESSFNPNAISKGGDCYGLMQVNSYWHRYRMAEFGVTDLFDSKSNIKVGTDYMLDIMSHGNPLTFALLTFSGDDTSKPSSEYTEFIYEKAYTYYTNHKQ